MRSASYRCTCSPNCCRPLEAGQITPVGSDLPIHVDTRLIAATNRDLSEEVLAGRFRDDLYYRINVIELIVPPLSERQDDILSLARRFATEFARAPVPAVTPGSPVLSCLSLARQCPRVAKRGAAILFALPRRHHLARALAAQSCRAGFRRFGRIGWPTVTSRACGHSRHAR